MRCTAYLLAAVLLSCGMGAQAAPVTFNVTPTITAPASGGAVTSYSAFRDCSGTPTLIGAAVSGTVFSFSAEPTPAPTVCIRATGPGGVGGFTPAVPLNAIAPPGVPSVIYTCDLGPTGGVCTVN